MGKFLFLIPKYIHIPVSKPVFEITRHIRPILIIISVLFLIDLLQFPLSASVLSSKNFVIQMLYLTRRPSSTSIQDCTSPRLIFNIGFRRKSIRSQKCISTKKKKLQTIWLNVSITVRIQNNNSGKVLYLLYLIKYAHILRIAMTIWYVKRAVVMYITVTITFSCTSSTTGGS